MTSLLTATSLPPGASEEMAEAEPVLVESDGLSVTLTLESGERLVFDRAQFEAALSASAFPVSGEAA